LQGTALHRAERPEPAAEGRTESGCLQAIGLRSGERPERAAEGRGPVEAAYATRRRPTPCLSP